MKKSKFMVTVLAIALVVFVVALVWRAVQINIPLQEQNYILTIIVAAATLATIIVALLSLVQYFQYKEIVHREVKVQIDIEMQKVYNLMSVQLEVAQKMSALYGLKDPDKKILMIHDVLVLDPKAYNAKIALAYIYWYDKKEVARAKELFMEVYSQNREGHQAAVDLAALYLAEDDDKESTYRWLENAIKRKADLSESIVSDKRFYSISKESKFKQLMSR